MIGGKITRARFCRRAVAVSLLSVAASLLDAREPEFGSRYLQQQQEAAMKFIVSTTNPEYPILARRLRREGSGLFWLHFDKTGRTDAVKIVQSTGHAELNQAAVNAFYRWRCQPGKLDQVMVPVTFTLAYRSVGVHRY